MGWFSALYVMTILKYGLGEEGIEGECYTTPSTNQFVILHKDLKTIYKFDFEEKTKVQINFDQSAHNVEHSCLVNFQNQFWIFGGYNTWNDDNNIYSWNKLSLTEKKITM